MKSGVRNYLQSTYLARYDLVKDTDTIYGIIMMKSIKNLTYFSTGFNGHVLLFEKLIPYIIGNDELQSSINSFVYSFTFCSFEGYCDESFQYFQKICKSHQPDPKIVRHFYIYTGIWWQFICFIIEEKKAVTKKKEFVILKIRK